MIKPIPIEKLKHFMWHEGDEVANPEPVKSDPEKTDLQGNYIQLEPVAPFGTAVKQLQDACKADSDCIQPLFPCSDGLELYRPLTFRENLLARVNEFNREGLNAEERVRLFLDYQDSCAGIAYEAGSDQFKIIPVCKELITLSPTFDKAFLPVNFNDLEGEILDRTKAIYNTVLTKTQVLEHEGWLTALENDKDLFKEYTNILFPLLKKKYGHETGMGFYLRSVPSEDQLRPLFVDNLYYNSNAGSINIIDSSASFLRVTQSRVGDER